MHVLYFLSSATGPLRTVKQEPGMVGRVIKLRETGGGGEGWEGDLSYLTTRLNHFPPIRSDWDDVAFLVYDLAESMHVIVGIVVI